MNKRSGNDIRKTFLRFFEERGHRIVRSSSLVPANDATLLFTNAGMNQFKDVFLGLEQRDYNRATSCQKCVRAGGKHNDLENVGFTNRHHTFFEMLGNFSFGDYFKEDAIAYAWELVTSERWFGIPIDKLYFTVFGGAEISPKTKLPPDNDAAKLWVETGAPKDRVFEIPGLKENFWQMGDTGPCGPCSEIFYDMGPKAVDEPQSPACSEGTCKFPCDCGRYVEIWNLVFMQFNRDADGRLNPLPKPSVDTGLGLERTAAVLQGVISNYDTDLFQPLMREAAKLANVDIHDAKIQPSLRIIADHSRGATFLISDGVIPSNEGRGYVLRKIIRRAIRHGRLIGAPTPFLPEMASAVRDEMQGGYRELEDTHERVSAILAGEEKRFSHTLEMGLRKLEEELAPIGRSEQYRQGNVLFQSTLDLPFGKAKQIEGDIVDVRRPGSRGHRLSDLDKAETYELDGKKYVRVFGDGVQIVHEKHKPLTLPKGDYEVILQREYSPSPLEPSKVYPGNKAFRLYDTFGLPLDFIQDVTRDKGILLDEVGFERAMEEQRAQSKASWKGAHKEPASPVYLKLRHCFKTEPVFYFGTKTCDARVEAIVKDGTQVNEIPRGAEAEVVLDRTTIYAESGGQVADTGALYDKSESLEVAEVRGAYYPVSGLIAHRIVAKEDLRVGDRVSTVADPERRIRDMRNHTATHLVHAALRNILGTHVKQAGSLVAPDHLRFDFSHFAQVDPSELREIEQQVNEEILKNLELRTDIMNIDDALASGALAFFGDKYPEANVRVVTIPDAASPRGFYSKELCGGTHVARTGEIGLFKVTSEQSTAAGVRRIEAISGDRGLAEYQRALTTLRDAATLLNTSEDGLIDAISRQLESTKQLERQIEGLRRKSAGSQAQDLLENARSVNGVRYVAAQVSGVDRENLRQMADVLRQKMGSGVVVLFSADDGKVALITAVTKDLTSKLHAGKIVQELAKLVGGSGGGRPDLAEAGGKDPSGIDKALNSVQPLLERLL